MIITSRKGEFWDIVGQLSLVGALLLALAGVGFLVEAGFGKAAQAIALILFSLVSALVVLTLAWHRSIRVRISNRRVRDLYARWCGRRALRDAPVS
jgi:hypothetical protein